MIDEASIKSKVRQEDGDRYTFYTINGNIKVSETKRNFPVQTKKKILIGHGGKRRTTDLILLLTTVHNIIISKELHRRE